MINKSAFAIYHADDRGYSRGDPIAIYPFRAAAEKSKENQELGGYS